MNQHKIQAALDYSWNEASFAVAENGKVLASAKIMLEGHDSSRLASELESCAKEQGIDPASVEDWTVGVGPGGFTGMRVASGLVAGFVYGKENIRFRGMPTAVAIARTAWKKSVLPDRILTLFDGRHHELLAYGMKSENASCFPDGFTAVLRSAGELAEAESRNKYKFAALEKDRCAVRDFDPALEDKVYFISSIDAEELIFNDPENYAYSPTDLIYLREAVFVAPKTPRILP